VIERLQEDARGEIRGMAGGGSFPSLFVKKIHKNIISEWKLPGKRIIILEISVRAPDSPGAGFRRIEGMDRAMSPYVSAVEPGVPLKVFDGGSFRVRIEEKTAGNGRRDSNEYD